MPGHVNHETVERLRDRLLAQCEQVRELDRRTIVRFWRDWNAAYPLQPKSHCSILKANIVARLCAVLRSLKGRHAIAAYERQAADDIFVVCIDALVGWRCRASGMPRLYDLDANLIVTSADFAWTLGTQGNRGWLLGDPVFVEPEMLPEDLWD